MVVYLRAECRGIRATPPTSDRTEEVVGEAAVAEALASLSVTHRQVLNETILRGRTVDQAAGVLGIPVGAVKSRVYLALSALQVVLEEKGVRP